MEVVGVLHRLSPLFSAPNTTNREALVKEKQAVVIAVAIGSAVFRDRGSQLLKRLLLLKQLLLRR